ncbi:hypothetical protein A9Z44_01705 [Mycoplasmopsis bovis]|nr:hypothetical protein A9Z44_01705 [Mycoplasmopsis bovis]TQF63861.1 hypothetical protein BA914_01820 [Mycoplasmopsis bovis]
MKRQKLKIIMKSRNQLLHQMTNQMNLDLKLAKMIMLIQTQELIILQKCLMMVQTILIQSQWIMMKKRN